MTQNIKRVRVSLFSGDQLLDAVTADTRQEAREQIVNAPLYFPKVDLATVREEDTNRVREVWTKGGEILGILIWHRRDWQ